MKKTVPALLLIALIAGITLGGCATFAQKDRIPQKTIPIISMVPSVDQPTGEIIANYWNFIGFNFNYDVFVNSIQGRDYDVVIKNYLVVSEIIAYTKQTTSP